MAAQSLSPRPEIVITSIWSFFIVGASLMAYATACADSIAGIIPSVLARYSKAHTASSSVTAHTERGQYHKDEHAQARYRGNQVPQK